MCWAPTCARRRSPAPSRAPWLCPSGSQCSATASPASPAGLAAPSGPAGSVLQVSASRTTHKLEPCRQKLKATCAGHLKEILLQCYAPRAGPGTICRGIWRNMGPCMAGTPSVPAAQTAQSFSDCTSAAGMQGLSPALLHLQNSQD